MTAAKFKVLAIDDEQDSLDILNTAIAQTFPGASFFTAMNGPHGIALALSAKPDIILLDIAMPEPDGFETCRQVKEDARLCHIPVVFITALKPEKETLEKAFTAGAEALILKPLELWELASQIRAMLKVKAANISQQADQKNLGLMVTQRTRELADELAAREKTIVSLKKSEELFRAIFDEAPLGIALNDSTTGHIYELNRKFSAIVGRTMEQMANTDWMSITHPEDLSKSLEMMAHVNSGKLNSFQMEKRYLKPDGTVVWVNLTVTPLKIGDKNNPRHLCLIEDISAVKAAQEEKLELEEQLRQAQKMETAGNLAGGIAHDFNNILSVILAYSGSFLKSLEQTDPRRKDAEEINKAGERAAALTRQLLTFSRKQVLQPKVLDINQVVQDIKIMLDRLLGENIKLIAVTDKSPVFIKADQGYLEQVLMNLAVNARDAMPKGGELTLEVSLARIDQAHIHRHGIVEPGSYAMLSVSDTGTGMSVETQSHIFEPFFTTKPRDKGTGLGLSIVHGIIKQSGGSIIVHSKEGEGTIFKIYFPLITGEAPITEHPSDIKELFTGTGTILVVDDDVQIRTLVRRALTLDNFTVLEAASAEEAIATCKRHKSPIHLILTDMVLPKMSGFELAEQLKTTHPDMKILFMSGYTEHSILEQGVLNPDKNFIQKPFAIDALTRKVRTVLSHLSCIVQKRPENT